MRHLGKFWPEGNGQVPTIDEFLDRVRGCLADLTDDRGITPNEELQSPEGERRHLAFVIHVDLGVEALLQRTPVDPPQLLEIAKQIEELPLVRQIVGDWPYVGVPDSTIWDRDLPVLKAKLQEMLEYPVSRVPKKAAPKAQPKPQGEKQTDLSHFIDLTERARGSGLTEAQRECFSLRFEYGLKVTEIAERLGKHYSTVQQHISAAEIKIEASGVKEKAQTRRAIHEAEPADR